MIQSFPNMIAPDQFEAMSERVLKMNTGIDEYVLNEMFNHKKSYDPITGERMTSFRSAGSNGYQRVPLVSTDGTMVNCEFLIHPCKSERVIFYVHGAAFIRRSNDINLKTADRLCEMTGQTVCIPDYRIGADYTYDQMVSDVTVCYRYLIRNLGYKPENISVIADSSGCVTALQTLREIEGTDIPAPGKIILWSPLALSGRSNDDQIEQGKIADIAFRTNNLFHRGTDLYLNEMGKGKADSEIAPAFGKYSALRNTEVLIQVGGSELLCDDSYMLHDIFSKVCSCTLEVYEDMFHNFQTYYSMCDTARFCWDRVVEFITDSDKDTAKTA